MDNRWVESGNFSHDNIDWGNESVTMKVGKWKGKSIEMSANYGENRMEIQDVDFFISRKMNSKKIECSVSKWCRSFEDWEKFYSLQIF